MNLHEVSFEDYLDIMAHADVFKSLETAGGLLIHVAEYAGNEVLVITEPITGNALVIESDDTPYGGSIHDQARYDRGSRP